MNDKNDLDITFEDIGLKDNYLHTGNYAISNIQQDYLNKGVLKTDITLENGNWDIIKAMIEKNLGIAIFPERYIKGSSNLLYKKIDHLSPDIYYCILIKKTEYTNSHIRKLIKLMESDFD